MTKPEIPNCNYSVHRIKNVFRSLLKTDSVALLNVLEGLKWK